jgi:hypothetical protein
MEPKGSVPYSQKHANGPYTVRDAFSPRPPTIFTKDPLYYLPNYAWYSIQNILYVSHLSHAFYMPRPNTPETKIIIMLLPYAFHIL